MANEIEGMVNREQQRNAPLRNLVSQLLRFRQYLIFWEYLQMGESKKKACAISRDANFQDAYNTHPIARFLLL